MNALKAGGSKAIFVITVTMFSGCAHDVANRYYGSAKYPPKKPEQVLLLARQPSQAFEVIADFQSRNETPNDLRAKAAEIGADAVIVSTLGGYYDRGNEWASQNASGTYSRIVGTAIVFRKGAQTK